MALHLGYFAIDYLVSFQSNNNDIFCSK